MKRVVITGAAGGVARLLRQELGAAYHLRLTDRRSIADLRGDEDFVRADLRDLAEVEEALRGMDGVVHLGGVPGEDDWEMLAEANITGTYNVFEAARRCDVPRVVFASSNHVVGFYPRAQTIDTAITVRPDSRYGVTKAVGEALGALYADKYGRAVTCLRIGWVKPEPTEPRDLSIWVSPRDLAQLVRIGLDHPDIHYEILYGVSDNARSWWDGARARLLGYRPLDRAEDYALAVLASAPPADPSSVEELMQGGAFTSSEGGGHPRPAGQRGRLLRWWARRADPHP